MTGLWWEWVVAGSVLATPWLALALMVERLGRNRVHPRVLHGLLAVAALEVVLPVGLVAVLPDPFVRSLAVAPSGAATSGLGVVGAAPLGAAAAPPWLRLALVAWAGAGLAFGLLLVGRTLRLHGRLRREGRRDRAVGEIAGRVAVEVGVPRPRVVLWDGAAGPFVAGVVRPLVVVPSGLARSLPPARLRHVLLHEIVHLRRRDLWWEAAWAALAAVFWFHPLLHVMRARARTLREACCDAEAARFAHPGPGGYRETLLLVGRTVLAAPRARAGAVASFARGSELVWRARVLEWTRWAETGPKRRAATRITMGVAAAGLIVGAPADRLPAHPSDVRPEETLPGSADRLATDRAAAPTSGDGGVPRARERAEAALEAHRDGTGGSIQLRNAMFGLRNSARTFVTDQP